MKFTAVLFATLLAVVPTIAVPQQASNTVAESSSATRSLTPQETCLNTCALGDVMCQARCVGVARPNEQQVNQTTECAMKCDQGDGSKEATDKYSDCVQGCIKSHFPAGQTSGPFVNGPAAAATTTAASGAAAATDKAQQTVASVTSNGVVIPNPTSPATTTATGLAATNGVMGGTLVSIAGLLIAALAL